VSIGYVFRRIAVFFVIVWVAATVNFAILRLAPGDPVAGMLARMAQQGGSVAGSDEIIRTYRQTFGLDEPLVVQYVKFVTSFARFDFGVSLSNYPTRVNAIIGSALPWTIGLLAVSTLVAFGLGTFMGALLAWRGTSSILRKTLPLLMIAAAIPYYVLAILLLAVFAFGLHLFPAAGTAPIGARESTGLVRAGEILRSSFLPALSLVLGGLGGWMLGMRALMVGVLGSDYLMLAEAKGLSGRRILFRYAIRNAILPQITVLALALGSIVSGAVLVEVIFSYPGLGSTLYRAIQNADYTLIQGITFVLVVAVGVAILILDLAYPLLDPRIRYARG
jgi:peptide/nickel transport system permease protein